MDKSNNPTTLAELCKRICVLKEKQKIKTGYVLKYFKTHGDAELKRYENGREIKEENIYVGYMEYRDFETFVKLLKDYVGRKKVYISYNYAKVLINYFREIKDAL